MHQHHASFGTYPSRLLGYYAGLARRRPRALLATALRTRSIAARKLLACEVGPVELDELLTLARTRGRMSRDLISARALAELGRVVALQDADASDQVDGLALLDLALDLFGPARVPQEHRGFHAQLALHLGDPVRAASLCRTYRGIPGKIRDPLFVDVANPFPAGSSGEESTWLRGFQQLFPWPPPTLASDVGGRPFDRLTAAAPPASATKALVSVIVTAFMPDLGLITAVRSLLNQSWSDLEILIIDDGSPAEYGDLLQHCAELDSRVRLIRLDTNGGTYRARNVGLDCAKGAMVTFHDSDDWSHPLRLEAQARLLLENASVLATTVNALGANDDLMITRPGRELLLPKQNSLMFCRNPVLQRIGYFDSVRKAADTEYQLRIRAAFGDDAVQEVESGPYALHRQRTDSLSGAEFRGGWVHPARAAYWFAYGAWHEKIRSGSAEPYLSKDPKTRPFAAGAHISGVDERVGAVDVAYVGDWRWFGETQRAAHDEIRGLTRRGLRVAVVQMESFRAMTTRRLPLCPPFQQLVNRGTVDQLLLAEAAEVGLLLVRQPEVLLFPPATISRIKARTVLIVAGETPVPPESTDYRYEPRVCAGVAEQLFSARTRWCPADAPIRDALSGYVEAADITPYDLPDSLDPRYWRLPRKGFRSHLPVAGVCGTDQPGGWPADRAALLQVYPDSPQVDVRLLGSVEVPRSLLGTGQVPSNWLIYEPVDVSIRSFLYQIDFYVYFPQTEQVGSRSRSLTEALAAGCVGIVPWDLDRRYDGGVVRCRPDEVRDVIDHYRTDEDAFLRQSRKAVAWVDRGVGGQSAVSRDPYHDLVTSLLGTAADAAPAEGLRGALAVHGKAR